MGSILLHLACISFIASWTISNSKNLEGARVRRAWHTLPGDDQMLYVLGFQELKRKGVLVQFTEAHQKATGSDEYNIHKTAQNLFWHSYWLYELEDAFRAPGDGYEDFTLPYWDVTKDALYWYNTENPKIEDIPIY